MHSIVRSQQSSLRFPVPVFLAFGVSAFLALATSSKRDHRGRLRVTYEWNQHSSGAKDFQPAAIVVQTRGSRLSHLFSFRSRENSLLAGDTVPRLCIAFNPPFRGNCLGHYLILYLVARRCPGATIIFPPFFFCPPARAF